MCPQYRVPSFITNPYYLGVGAVLVVCYMNTLIVLAFSNTSIPCDQCPILVSADGRTVVKTPSSNLALVATREDIIEESFEHTCPHDLGNVSMERSTISSWIRQARYRAKKQNIYSELEIDDVETIIEAYDGNCAYCGSEADTLDQPFPIKETAPNVSANVLPCCKDCKSIKKSNDLVWMFSSKHIDQERYLELLQQMLSRSGGDQIRKHVRRVTGIVDGDQSE